ncbi:cation transporter [Halovulum dunhuangense]|uniref:Cation transporter n=1 Tax=Halovulum dunhuangense TaxID=1505036 RepID=A0A849L6C6_9RHOB|nr:cation diffusion facilitator family transporter [Halovulum dunhuangense]NNU81680.1 cation transporter [Halovulum dunhuangense]
MPHDHAHDHGTPADLGPAFRWAVGLNTAYVIVEAAAGFLTGSLALLADAAHNLTDVAGLLIAWGAAVLAKHSATRAHSWGLGRATIMAAMLNALAILIGVVWVIWEAAHRFQTPVDLPGLTILVVALVGIAVNTGSALLFMRARKVDLNARGAFLHMAADAAVSGAVVLAATGILLTGWTWLDPAVAIAVSLLIAVTAAGLFREALHLSLDGVPGQVDPAAVADWLGRQDGVRDVHDLHIWPLSTTHTALSVHVVSGAQDTDAVLHVLAEGLKHEFGIAHSTIQVEREPCGTSCLRPGA